MKVSLFIHKSVKTSLVVFTLFSSLFISCKIAKQSAASSHATSFSVATTIFAPYDFTRQIIAGTDTQVTMLLPPGAEVHSWEPSAQDILTIQQSGLFIYAGGEGDAWADDLVSSLDKKVPSVRMTDCVILFEEAHPDGMEPEEDDDGGDGAQEVEWDEHVWTSPKNAMLIVNRICDTLCALDKKNSALYRKNADSYLGQLQKLDDAFSDVVKKAKRNTIIFADRFPARYFTEEFGLSYYAAFPGCSTNTEPSAATVAFIITKVKEEKIPAVFYIELSNQKMADTVCEATGCKKLLFNCCHNLSKSDFAAGKTYLSAMEDNVLTLTEALN